jgi:hypothetical protein
VQKAQYEPSNVTKATIQTAQYQPASKTVDKQSKKLNMGL